MGRPIHIESVSLAGSNAEHAFRASDVFNDQGALIKSAYLEGDGSNDFEYGFKSGATGSIVWFSVPSNALSANVEDVDVDRFYLRSANALTVRVLLYKETAFRAQAPFAPPFP